jgi:hypothetical protein
VTPDTPEGSTGSRAERALVGAVAGASGGPPRLPPVPERLGYRIKRALLGPPRRRQLTVAIHPEDVVGYTRPQGDNGFAPEYDVDRAVPDYVACCGPTRREELQRWHGS